jgi:hypothetical protein
LVRKFETEQRSNFRHKSTKQQNETENTVHQIFNQSNTNILFQTLCFVYKKCNIVESGDQIRPSQHEEELSLLWISQYSYQTNEKRNRHKRFQYTINQRFVKSNRK